MSNKLNTSRSTWLLAAILACVACDDDEDIDKADGGVDAAADNHADAATTTTDTLNDGAGTDVSSSALTYWDDVAPMLFGKCVKCHQQGGVAPFRLDNYADASKWAIAAALATRAGIMPPYLMTHDGSCGDFVADGTLTQAEKDVLWTWAHGERLEGAARPLSTPAVAALETNRELKTPDFAPVVQKDTLGPLAEFDEYRCFILDIDFDKDQFVTGFEVLPGNPAIIHHLIAYAVDPVAPSEMDGVSNGQLMAAMDAQSPERAGWLCFGGVGPRVTIASAPVTWAPGAGPVRYPDGSGVLIKKGQKLVAQVHYNLADPTLMNPKDQSTVRLRLADDVPRAILTVLPDPFLASLREAQPHVIPPGQPAFKYTWKRTREQLGLPALPGMELLMVGPHMHERGKKWTLTIADAPAAPRCIGHVERWDFHWQLGYLYRTPVAIQAQSEIALTCEYDTSGDSAPVLPGWGTRNEMCLATLFVALPPGVKP